MKPAQRLSAICVDFKGPHSPDLFKELFVPREAFDTYTIGTGESKAVAVTRAISHLIGKGYSPILSEIENQVEALMPNNSHYVEGDANCQVYCILYVSAER